MQHFLSLSLKKKNPTPHVSIGINRCEHQGDESVRKRYSWEEDKEQLETNDYTSASSLAGVVFEFFAL